jgi:tRNA nucleotidyltransferase (CCA-adding enzyme)
LQEVNGHLSLIHATLLLLGIYEDSGSLTYAHTTPRDAAAVAYLLENGASLKIAADFLNQPLSPAQHMVFDDLLARAESLTMQNCKVMLSSADAADLEDEVSSIAHKICDLLDPDALFIFVRTARASAWWPLSHRPDQCGGHCPQIQWRRPCACVLCPYQGG